MFIKTINQNMLHLEAHDLILVDDDENNFKQAEPVCNN